MSKKCLVIGLALFLPTFLGCDDDAGSAGSGSTIAAGNEAGTDGTDSQATDAGEEVAEAGDETGTGDTDSRVTDAGEEAAEAGDEAGTRGTDGGETDASAELPDASTVIYKTVDGHDIHADVYTPADDETGAAILSIHGGALMLNNRLQINPDLLNKSLAAGFTVVSIDYRLAPETKLPEIVTDVQDAYTWMRGEGSSRFGFDADRISVMGLSAGGYLTLVTGYRFSPRPRALLSFYGYGDISGTWQSQPSDGYLQLGSISEEDARATVGTETISDGPRSRLLFYFYCRQQG